jgi:hypothetical protein
MVDIFIFDVILWILENERRSRMLYIIAARDKRNEGPDYFVKQLDLVNPKKSMLVGLFREHEAELMDKTRADLACDILYKDATNTRIYLPLRVDGIRPSPFE